MKIGFGSDHAGFQLKETIKKHLSLKGIEVVDFGPHSEESVDYPDYAHPLANAIESNELPLGIAICGSGNGISMALNKHQNIRAALCWNTELAALAKQHNNANILSLPARFITEELALQIVDEFLSNNFEGGRHQRRVEKISCK
jgi:ribose 5-phosphate isomerase B